MRVGKVFLVGEKGMTGSISSRDEKPRGRWLWPSGIFGQGGKMLNTKVSRKAWGPIAGQAGAGRRGGHGLQWGSARPAPMPLLTSPLPL